MTEVEKLKDLNDLLEQTKRNKYRVLRDQFAWRRLLVFAVGMGSNTHQRIEQKEPKTATQWPMQ